MATLRQLVTSIFTRKPTAKVYINHEGRQWDVSRYVPNVAGAINFTETFGQPISGGTIRFIGSIPFSPAIKDIIEIHLGYDGQTRPAFVGLISDPQSAQFPKGWVCQFRNILYLADFPVQQGTGATWVDTDGNVITEQTEGIVILGPGGTPNDVLAKFALETLLRDWSGIPGERVHIPDLTIDGTNNWILGQESPVAWTGVSPLQAALEIASVLGYWLYADAAGHVRMVFMGGGPADEADFVIEEGVNTLASKPFTVSRNVDTFYNQVEVTGGNTFIVGEAALPVRDVYRVDSDLLPGGRSRVYPYSNRLIEYVNRVDGGEASATAVAERLMKEWSRIPQSIGGTIKGNPYLAVGQTIGFISPRLGFPTQTNFFIYSLSTSFGGGVYEQSLTLDGGVGSEGYTTIPPPVAAFTYRLHQEFLDDEMFIEVFVDGGASSSFGGAVLTWTWSAPAPADPTAGTGQYWMVRVPEGTTEIAITLSVTDTTGKISDPVTLVIPLTDATSQLPTTRRLSLAMGNRWYASENGGRTWGSSPIGTYRKVPPISAGGEAAVTDEVADAAGLLATNGASVEQTLDLLATAPTAIGALPAEPGFMWQHEADPTIVYAIVGKNVYRSLNTGATWTLMGTPPIPDTEVDQTGRWIVASIDNSNIVDVLVGRFAWTSFDGGVNWTEVEALAGPPGYVATAYASGFERHWVSFRPDDEPGDPPEWSSPVRAIEGDIVAFPDVEPPVRDVRALTMMVDRPYIYAFDVEGRVWRIDADSGNNATHVATLPEPPV